MLLMDAGGIGNPGWAGPEDAQSALAPPPAGPGLPGADPLRNQASARGLSHTIAVGWREGHLEGSLRP